MQQNGILRATAWSNDAERLAAFWLTTFILLQIACQLLLMIPALVPLRVVFRSAAFLVSLLFLIMIPGREQSHPAKVWLVLALIVIALGIFHPFTNTASAAIAHLLLNVAIAAPVFWVSRLHVTEVVLRRIVVILWLFHIASATVGVLQMHFPGRFQPGVSKAIKDLGQGEDSFKIHLRDGTEVYRPMGLTDTPGGAAAAGLYAVVFSLGVYVQNRTVFFRFMSMVGFTVGFFCLYMGHVRVLLVMAVICTGVFVAVLVRRKEIFRYFELAVLVPIIATVTFLWAAQIGGTETVDRNKSLFEARMDKVYQKNRGIFLTQTVTQLLPEYPLGAGLGRYGMMRKYFGDSSTEALWVEIQLTGWLLDGGIPLIILYSVAILITTWVSLRIALSRLSGGIPLWGALLFALNIGNIAVTFNYALFLGQMGMEFWLLNMALFMATVVTSRRVRLMKAKSTTGLGRKQKSSVSRHIESIAGAKIG